MKTYQLISREDLLKIAQYMDRIADMFPTDAIPEVSKLKAAAYEALSSVQDAGQEGLVHAKLDTILAEVSFIADKKRYADELVGPVVVRPPRTQLGSGTSAQPSRIPRGGIFEDRVVGGAGDPKGAEDFDQFIEEDNG